MAAQDQSMTVHFKRHDTASLAQSANVDTISGTTADRFPHVDQQVMEDANDSDVDNAHILLLPNNSKQSRTRRYREVTMNEHLLSQKMSQLSTHASQEKPTLMKSVQDEINRIPDYLTKQNASFKQMIGQVLSTMALPTTNQNIEELRKITIARYRAMLVPIYRTLWTTYLQSGMGQLIIISSNDAPLNYSTNVPIWPKEIQRMLRQSTNLSQANQNDICMNFVTGHINAMNYRLQKHEAELNTRVARFSDHQLTAQTILGAYIEQNLASLRKENEHKIELVHHDYHIQALKLAFGQHHPNGYQKQLMKQLCCSKYQQETSEHQLRLLQQRIAHFKASSPPFECSPLMLNQLPLINSVPDLVLRQQIIERYREVTEKAQNAIFSTFLKAAEQQVDKCRREWHTNVQKMWSDHRASSGHAKTSLVMMNLIEQRCNKIGERVRCAYEFISNQYTPLAAN